VARKKTPKVRVNVKAQISSRLREIRQELFGEHGGPELARRLDLPARTWYNYETGVTVPAEVLLSFIDQTGTNPLWLLNGEGPKYRRGLEDMVLSELSPVQLIRRGLEKLEQEPSGDIVIAAPENLPSESISEFVAVPLIPLADLLNREPRTDHAGGHVMAYRKWLPHPKETVAVRMEDDAMHPILPMGSIVAIDRAITDPQRLQGRLVAACHDGLPMIRWLKLSGRYLFLEPNQESREHPTVPVELSSADPNFQVVWSWSRFSGS
jgi:hypothetical protein